jgi:PAS domain S-box-containing protein
MTARLEGGGGRPRDGHADEYSDTGPRQLRYTAAMDQAHAAEERPLESEAMLRSIVETLPGFVMLIDRDYRLLFVNRIGPGFTGEQVIGASMLAFIQPEFHDLVKQTCEEVWKTGEAARYEIAGAGPRGTLSWYSSYVSPVLRDGKVVGLTVTTNDITERKQTEQARIAIEARFRAAVEASLDVFVIFQCDRDPTGKIVDFVFEDLNARAVAVLGGRREEVVGKRLCDLRPDVRDTGLFDKYVRVVETGEPMDAEALVLRPPGLTAWTHQQAVPLANGVAVSSRDISAKKQMEAELRTALERQKLYAEELEQKNRQLAEENAERLRTEQIMRKQQETMRAMSTPIIQAWEGVLVLPVIGALESARATQMMERLLGEIVRTRGRFAVLDLTGVDAVDGATVAHLLSIVRATNLLGSRCLVSGISPSIARTMTEIGASSEGFLTFGLLQDALRYALLSSGIGGPNAERPAEIR